MDIQYTVLQTERKMARRFAKVSEEEIEEAFFHPSDLSILKQLSPSGSVKSGRYIYLDALRLDIYLPLFTSPSGDSCILFATVHHYSYYSLFATSEFTRISAAALI